VEGAGLPEIDSLGSGYNIQKPIAPNQKVCYNKDG
jgi:hypothetical protein